MFSKIAIRLPLPFLVAMLFFIIILSIVRPVATLNPSINTESTDGGNFIYLPIVQKPLAPPTSNWIRKYSNTDNSDLYFVDFAQSSQDKYVVVGWTKEPTGMYRRDIGFITALDGEGKTLWQTGIDGGTATHLTDVIITSDNYIIALGISSERFVTKFTMDGDLVWVNLYGDNSDGSSLLLELEDGSYLTIGTTWTYGNGSLDTFLMNISSDGSIVWQKTIGGANFDFISAAVETSKGTVLLMGKTESTGSYKALWVLELAMDGTVLWQKVITESDCVFNSIIELEDGHFLAAGGGNKSGCLLKIKNDGTPVSHKEIGSPSYAGFSGLVETSNNKIIATGTRMRPEPSPTRNDGWLVALDADGNILWEKIYGEGEAEFFDDIGITNSGQLAILGGAYLFADEQNVGLLLKLDPDGSLENCNLINTISSIVTDTVTTASSVSFGSTTPTNTLKAMHTLYNISLDSNLLCSGESNLMNCE